MNKYIWIVNVFLSLFLTSAFAESRRPNVLLVVADDLGYTDLGSFGGEIETPNLDALAKSGLRLSQFYTAATCSPTRAMLMTGVDHHKVGLGAMAEALAPNQRGKLGYEGHLNDRAAFLPGVFADAGYRTLMSGKWHLGHDKVHSPTARGFHKSFALLDGGAGHLSDLGLNSMHAAYRENGEPVTLPDDFYSSRFYTDKMIEYIETERESGKPFFGYLAYTAPHWPLQAPDASIAKYKNRYAMGYDQLHSQRVEKDKALGLTSDAAATAPRQPGQKPWQALTQEEQKIEQRTMEIYAAMVDDMDQHFGRLINYLKDIGELDNTIIFFMSDNGAEGASLDKEHKRFRQHVETCCDNRYENMGKANSYLFQGPNWARASVGPARDYKGSVSEGGIHAPAFVWYSGMQNAHSISDQFVTVKDVLPTLLDLASIPLPSGKELPVEGRSFLTSSQNVSADMGWELFGGKAYRQGHWKLVHRSPMQGGKGWQLYNLKNDPLEQSDLSEQHPQKLQDMMQLWLDYEKRNQLIYPKFKH